ncbi:hypothetical protein AB3S75_012146 [Citrus x aurantiifolia]
MNQNDSNLKYCTDCKTTKTPLWRGGPAGPKSLCNACGIRFRKKKRVFEGLKKRSDKKKDKTTNAAAAASASAKVVAEKADGTGNASCCVNGLGDSFKMRLMALGQEVLLQRSSPSSSSPSTTSKSSPSLFLPSVVAKKQRCQRKRKLKEEEQAAFSLMALSCGFVFA